MKSVAFVPIVLITCSASPTRKGGRKWHRKPENLEDAKKLRRRFMKITDVKDVGLLAKGGGYYDEKEEAYDPAAYDVTAAASYEDKRRLVDAGMSGSCPPGDVVTCVDGFATSVGNATVGNPTCQEACAAGGGECCVGDGTYNGEPINSCTGFNGKVCKSGDIPSCSDNRTSGEYLGRACFRAKIDEVVNGCNGRGACQYAGENGGGIGRVVNGCNGYSSCVYAASDGGYIKEIVDSCIGRLACIRAAGIGGNIGSITNGSCVGELSCEYAARVGGYIGYINHGCRGEGACQYAAYERSIDGISYACNNISACDSLASGRFGYASVNSVVVSCCNDDSECTGGIVDASGLPDQCPTPSPTSSPTTAEPTVGPTVNPVTASPTTSSPNTASPTTSSPNTASPTTSSPITVSPTTVSPITVSPTTVSPVTSLPTDSPVSSTSSPTVDGLSGKSGKSLSKSSTSSPTVDGLSAKSGKSLSKTETLSPKATGLSKSGKGGRPLFTKAIKGAVDSIQDEQQISMIQDEQQISLDLDDAHVVQILQDLITTGRLKKEMELGDVIAELGGDDTHYEFV